MRFENADLLWLFLLVPIACGFVVLERRKRRQRLERFADASLWSAVAPHMARRSGRREVAAAGLIAAALVVAALRPQWGYIWREGQRRGIDIMVALDVSKSMLTRDVTPTRLERARRKVIDLLGHLRGDRIGLITFAGLPFLETPLTFDYGTYRTFLQSVNPEIVPLDGTNVEAALEKAISALVPASAGVRDRREKAIVLITDGEEFDGDMTAVRQRAEELGIRIYIIGIGTPEGGPIVLQDGYKKDAEGNIIISRLRPQALQELALRTGGIYVQSVATDEDVKAMYDRGIAAVFRGEEISVEREKQWNEYFQFPLALALLLLLWGGMREMITEPEAQR